jgi:hypothetical protein
VQSFDRPYPHTGLPSLARVLSFRSSSPAYPHDPLDADRLLSTDTVTIRLAAALGCFDLGPLPPSHSHSTAHRVLAASADAQSHLLHSAVRSTSPHVTLEGSPTCQSGFGLAIRLVVGGHHSRLRPTSCPRFPSMSPWKLLGSDGAPTSHCSAIVLAGYRSLAISA